MQDKLFSVADQVVLVAGASRGIGRVLAGGFAERDAKVVIAGREAQTLEKTAKEISTGTHPVTFEVCDVAKPEDVANLVKNVIGKFGHIDTLVSVAGVNKRMKAQDYPIEDYDWILNINLRGAFVVAQAVGRHMIERGSGAIIKSIL
jgi:gluconate 5-dehydrogenase